VRCAVKRDQLIASAVHTLLLHIGQQVILKVLDSLPTTILQDLRALVLENGLSSPCQFSSGKRFSKGQSVDEVNGPRFGLAAITCCPPPGLARCCLVLQSLKTSRV